MILRIDPNRFINTDHIVEYLQDDDSIRLFTVSTGGNKVLYSCYDRNTDNVAFNTLRVFLANVSERSFYRSVVDANEKFGT